MNLEMRVPFLCEIIETHCDECVLALATINIINHRLFVEKTVDFRRVRLGFETLV